jgi:hypothetical protein
LVDRSARIGIPRNRYRIYTTRSSEPSERDTEELTTSLRFGPICGSLQQEYLKNYIELSEVAAGTRSRVIQDSFGIQHSYECEPLTDEEVQHIVDDFNPRFEATLKKIRKFGQTFTGKEEQEKKKQKK